MAYIVGIHKTKTKKHVLRNKDRALLGQSGDFRGLGKSHRFRKRKKNEKKGLPLLLLLLLLLLYLSRRARDCNRIVTFETEGHSRVGRSLLTTTTQLLHIYVYICMCAS